MDTYQADFPTRKRAVGRKLNLSAPTSTFAVCRLRLPSQFLIRHLGWKNLDHILSTSLSAFDSFSLNIAQLLSSVLEILGKIPRDQHKVNRCEAG